MMVLGIKKMGNLEMMDLKYYIKIIKFAIQFFIGIVQNYFK